MFGDEQADLLRARQKPGDMRLRHAAEPPPDLLLRHAMAGIKVSRLLGAQLSLRQLVVHHRLALRSHARGSRVAARDSPPTNQPARRLPKSPRTPTRRRRGL